MIDIDTSTAANAVALSRGKSWGAFGIGPGNGVTTTTDAAYGAAGSGTGLGVTWLRGDGTTASPCKKHYMIIQVGTPASAASAQTQDSKVTFGAKEFARTMKVDTAPTAASDPKTPKTSAQMLTIGAALVVSSLTLF